MWLTNFEHPACRVLNVFVKGGKIDSSSLRRTPGRSLEICDFIGKNSDFCGVTTYQKENGAVEWIRTTTVLLPPAPQAGASASSATTALRKVKSILAAPRKSGKARSPNPITTVWLECLAPVVAASTGPELESLPGLAPIVLALASRTSAGSSRLVPHCGPRAPPTPARKS
jgi:hypothetical protein